MHTKITANKPNIVTEDFEDEVILVSLVNGNYYSLRSTAATMWKAIEQGVATDELTSTFKSTYSLDGEQIAGIELFLGQLLEHQLIKEFTGETDGNRISVDSNQAFENPIVEAYSDMQDLLLLDPIHDVDEETGWPAKPASDDKAEG